MCSSDLTPGGKDRVLLHAVYADDLLHFYNDVALFNEFNTEYRKRFEVKTAPADVYLGNRVTIDAAKLTVGLDQHQYLADLLQRLQMQDSTPVATPIVSRLSQHNAGERLSPADHATYRMVVGSLLYLACWTRPDISFAVSELSRFVSAPAVAHMKAVKHLLRYLKGTMALGIVYSKTGGGGPINVLAPYVDADWAGDPDSRRSTTGYVILLKIGRAHV